MSSLCAVGVAFAIQLWLIAAAAFLLPPMLCQRPAISRRRRVAGAILRRALLRGLAWSIPLLVACLALRLAGGGPAIPSPPPHLLLAWIVGAPATGGCLAMLFAAGLESRGRVYRARRLAREAGWLVSVGCGALMLALLIVELPHPRPSSVTAIFLLGSAGTAGLLAGLSRKPLPSGPLAAALYIAGWVALALFEVTPSPGVG